MKEISEVTPLEETTTIVNAHVANANKAKVTVLTSGMLPWKRTYAEKEIRSLHFYCLASDRYFVITGLAAFDESEELKAKFQHALDTFKCH